MTEFEQAIKGVINKYSEENPSNTPDFILAMYLSNCLAAWNQATQQRETWYGRDAGLPENHAHQWNNYLHTAYLLVRKPQDHHCKVCSDCGRLLCEVEQ